MSTTNQIIAPMNAARVCDAIAKIGYTPASAIMDIVDNSVTANALNVRIILDIDSEKTLVEKNNVQRYIIVDDGKGMTNDEAQNALTLGSIANYAPNSLSKYGMGLKSAGLSLGTKIVIVSKTNNNLTNKYFIDRTIIEEKKDYIINIEELSPEETEYYSTLLGDSKSGTIVEISGCQNIQQHSAQTTIRNLEEKLGVTYYSFLSKKTNPLNLTIEYKNNPYIIKPYDILFKDKSYKTFDPSTYDCKKPCLVVTEDISVTDGSTDVPIKLEVTLFPKQSMSTYAEFTKEERDLISSFKIGKKNKGFFIYRNNRLIRWGDDIDGLVPRDCLGFRARILISTEHDDFLHVDVSKQNIMIPEDIKNAIQTAIRNALKHHREIFAMCDNLVAKDEGAEFNQRNELLNPEDPDDILSPSDSNEVKKRKKKIIEDTKSKLPEETDEEKFIKPTTTEEEGIPALIMTMGIL